MFHRIRIIFTVAARALALVAVAAALAAGALVAPAADARDSAQRRPPDSERDFFKGLMEERKRKTQHADHLERMETIRRAEEKAAAARAAAEQAKKDEALHNAAGDGDLNRMRQLLDDGANMERPVGQLGRTALMAAAAKGRDGALRFLLEQGANVRAQDYAGFTALHRATQNSQPLATVRILVQAGAFVNARIYGTEYTPRDFAVRHYSHRSAGVSEFLRQHGGECRRQRC